MNVQQMCTGESALVPEGLRGYRMWNDYGALLTAVSHGVTWPVPEHVATCQANAGWSIGIYPRRYAERSESPHPVPSPLCTCGIYGWYRPTEARLQQGTVFGVVEATGRVLLGDFGFRAERARIVALVTDDEPITHYWTHRGVPVFESRERLLAEFPPQDVRELIGREIPDTPPDDPWSTFTMALTASGQQVQQIFRQFGVSTMQAATAQYRASRALAEVTDALPEDPMERALALRKQRNTGPQNRRKGRARLEAAPNA